MMRICVWLCFASLAFGVAATVMLGLGQPFYRYDFERVDKWMRRTNVVLAVQAALAIAAAILAVVNIAVSYASR